MQFIPTIKFEIASTDKEADLFCSFSRGERFTNIFNKVYPELFPSLAGKNKEESVQICKDFAEKQQKLHKDEMISFQQELQTAWEPLREKFLAELSNHFETEWPKDKPVIIGLISILPIFPRNINNHSFYIGHKNIQRMIEVAAHEIVHFLWYKKWSEVFPEISKDVYEAPHLTWRLSEIIDPIILQCNPKIHELIQPKHWGYTSFEKINIGDVKMIDYFKKMYLDSVNAGDNFATTMKKLWSEAQLHEKEISTF